MAALSPEQVRLVLRRAAELERRPDRESGDVAESELAEIAAEVGIAPSAVKHALAEVRAGVVTAEPAETSFADKLVGPAEVTASRVVHGSLTDIRAAITRFMQSQFLEIKRNLGEGGQIWEPAHDFGTRMRRAFSPGQKLSFEAGTEVSVQAVASSGVEGEVLVRLTVRLAEPRQRRAWAAAVGALSGAAIAVGGIIAFHTVGPEVASIIAGAGTAAGSLAAVRSTHKKDVVQSETAILRFLDTLEHGEPPAPERPSLSRWLSKWTW